MLFTLVFVYVSVFNKCPKIVLVYIVWAIDWTFSMTNPLPLTKNYGFVFRIKRMRVIYLHSRPLF
ncbi:hypothetical protein [Escherichia phage BI-EHEC]|nr:hypothetical protein [Escherichia phage BI-EHEC]